VFPALLSASGRFHPDTHLRTVVFYPAELPERNLRTLDFITSEHPVNHLVRYNKR
jgi:hypothetical protein